MEQNQATPVPYCFLLLRRMLTSQNIPVGTEALNHPLQFLQAPSKLISVTKKQIERQSRALDKKQAGMQAELREEAKESMRRDALENREALGLMPEGEGGGKDGEEGAEEEVAPPQVLKERIESVVEVLSDFQVGLSRRRKEFGGTKGA